MGELFFLLFFIVLSIYFFFLTGDFRISPLDKSGGASVWPRIVLVFLLLFLVIRLIQVVCTKHRKEFVFLDLFKGIKLFFLACFIGYIALFKFLGYYISTLLFLIITVNFFYKYCRNSWGTKKEIIIRNLVIIVFVTLMQLFFSGVLKIMLPSGIFFR